MSETKLSCPVCGSDDVAVVSVPEKVRARSGVALDFIDQRSRCARCGEEFYTRDQSRASSRAAAAVVREHEGLLPPERIRAIRESYNLTQADFERALGLGPKTVVRWESGTVHQGATANSLLLAIESNWQAFCKVAEAHGVEVTTVTLFKAEAVNEVTSKFVGTASTSQRRELMQFKRFRRIRPIPAKKAAMG